MFCSIKTLPALAFENLNSLETLNLQNNKLTFLAEEPIEPILDTLRTIDVSGNWRKLKLSTYLLSVDFTIWQWVPIYEANTCNLCLRSTYCKTEKVIRLFAELLELFHLSPSLLSPPPIHKDHYYYYFFLILIWGISLKFRHSSLIFTMIWSYRADFFQ